MPKAKMKTLVLLILLACNLGLLLTVLPTRLQASRAARETMQQLEQLFARYGLQLELAQLPEQSELPILEAQFDAGAQLDAARALLGEPLLAEQDGGSLQTVYTSQAGTCTLRRGSLSATLTDGPAAQDRAAFARSLLREMGLEAAELTEQADSSVTVTQALLDRPLFSTALTLRFSGGRLTGAEGTIYPLAGTLTALPEQATLGGADALVAFLNAREQTGWIGQAVTGARLGYRTAETAAADTLRLVPTWRIETDTGDYYVDALTGEVTPA